MTQTHARQIKLLLFPNLSGAHVAGWRHATTTLDRTHDLRPYIEMAKLSERGLFDAIFFADAQGFRSMSDKEIYSRNEIPRLEPLTLLSALSMVTKNLGLISTLSTSYNEPYSVARRLSTLDHISGGRAGWNVVTSTTENEAHNFGRDAHFGHAERYARAKEFIEVVKGLWDSWDEDAILADKDSGVFFDPDKLHGLNHAGEFFNVAGPLSTLRPPQGYPVIVQAGSSATGMALAAATAEIVFTTHPNLASAQTFYKALKDEVVTAGRGASDLLIAPAVQPIVAGSQQEADDIAGELDGLIHTKIAINALQFALGSEIDISVYDPDGPLPPIPETQGSKSIQARVVEMAKAEGLSIAQIGRRFASSRTSASFVGTATTVADKLEEWFTGGGADGFAIAPPYLPSSLEAFVDGVVPELQRRGLFRTKYEGETLRENLGLSRPVSRYQLDPSLHREPEIWPSKS
jgi:FMN-dependent oxidoreductase (nitrilotriacetate monooxygenase family)